MWTTRDKVMHAAAQHAWVMAASKRPRYLYYKPAGLFRWGRLLVETDSQLVPSGYQKVKEAPIPNYQSLGKIRRFLNGYANLITPTITV
jgi:hypothetical protein